MFMIDIIRHKKEGLKLTKEEIEFFIKGYVKEEIPDYQVSALLMAICFNGMDKEETALLTEAMRVSGEVIDLSSIKGIKVDKHSTGGVGDKTSLVLGPIVASLGGKVAKLSGRGLGHTGGTIDKLESIPGFSTSMSGESFLNQVNKVGLSIIGQTQNLVPADKKLYALRDVTGTVNAVPLIASSIMSKKLATGSDCILLDVKCGSGAFCTTIEDARRLATAMVDIGKSMNKNTVAYITNMDEPLGNAVGNILEVLEAIDTLHNKGPKEFRELCVQQASTMLVQSKLYRDEALARVDVEKVLEDGRAFNKFVEFVEAQGGDSSYVLDPSKFDKASLVYEVKSVKEGFVTHIDTIAIGDASCKLGGGRMKKGDPIDFTAGIIVNKHTGDKVNVGDSLCTIYTNKTEFKEQVEEIINAYTIGKEAHKLPIILEVIK